MVNRDATGAVVVLAGATGDLGQRVARALGRRGALVRALIRARTPEEVRSELRATGATLVDTDFSDPAALQRVCARAVCVISTLNGLEPTIVGVQGALLEAAVVAGVPRFMPSDFSLDFTKTRPGDNRNMDLRRAFQAQVDAAPIRATSVLNGAFADLLTG